MDDEDDALPWSISYRGKAGKGKGRHTLPDSGICWIWSLKHSCYTGFTVRDLSRGDLCVVKFLQAVKAAARMRGRRSCTRLPMEDRDLLKEECVHGGILMEVVGGTALEDACIGATCKFRDVEHMLQLTCPWSIGDGDAMRIEVDKAEATKLLGRPSVQAGATAVLADSVVLADPPEGRGSGSCFGATGAAAMGTGQGPSPSQATSGIQALLSGIGQVLSQLHQQDAMADLSLLAEALAAPWLNKSVFSFLRRRLQPNALKGKQF